MTGPIPNAARTQQYAEAVFSSDSLFCACPGCSLDGRCGDAADFKGPREEFNSHLSGTISSPFVPTAISSLRHNDHAVMEKPDVGLVARKGGDPLRKIGGRYE